MTAKGRVVHVVRSDTFAGVERYVCDVTGELSRRGWAVTVVGGNAEQMRHQLPGAVEHHPGTTTWQTGRALLRLGRTPLVHAHMTAAEAAAVLTSPLTRSLVLATRHFAEDRGRTPVIRAVGAILARRLVTEIAISQFVADAVGSRPRVLLNGVATRAATALGEQKVVLVLQRLEQEKDTATAIRAFASSGLVARGWVLYVAGRGSQRAALESLSDGLGIGANVQYLGFVTDPGPLRHSAGIFLATAVGEPFGLAVAEAMACGLPVVAADGGAHREVLGEAGRLYPPGDVATCAAMLRALAEDPSERARLGGAARRRQQSMLSLARHVDGLEAVYGEVVRR